MQKVTVPFIKAKKINKQRITMLTAYDYCMAKLLDEEGIDIILVGDSLGMVVLGYDSTTLVTMNDMIYHTKAVKRAVKNSLLVGDMPYKSFNIDTTETLSNALRFVNECGCDAVKMEGGAEIVDSIRLVVKSGVPVMGHIGLTPQTASEKGGFRVQGKTSETAKNLLADAKKLEEAGCFSIVLECVPEEIGKAITKIVKIPIIGIGAGRFCDGQVLVIHDVIGLYRDFTPRFVKKYVDVGSLIQKAIKEFKVDVEQGKFPSVEHTYTIPEEELRKFSKENFS